MKPTKHRRRKVKVAMIYNTPPPSPTTISARNRVNEMDDIFRDIQRAIRLDDNRTLTLLLNRTRDRNLHLEIDEKHEELIEDLLTKLENTNETQRALQKLILQVLTPYFYRIELQERKDGFPADYIGLRYANMYTLFKKWQRLRIRYELEYISKIPPELIASIRNLTI